MKHKPTKLQLTIVLVAVYIFLQLVANIAATKVIVIGKIVMDAGIIYSLTFTWRDLIHKQLGKNAAIVTIFTSAAINILASLYFLAVIHMPGQAEWIAAGGQTAWEFIFGIQMRIMIASIVTMVIAELADTGVYEVWTKGYGKDKPQWTRVIISNAVSIPIDSILFSIIAFSGVLSWPVLVIMIWSNILTKFVITAVSWWMIYLVPEKPIYRDE